MPQLIEVTIYCPSEEIAQTIAERMLAGRLAACANISGPVKSSYFWKGAVESASEYILLLKTVAERFDEVERQARELHPDEVPCIIGRKIEYVANDFREWVVENTGKLID